MLSIEPTEQCADCIIMSNERDTPTVQTAPAVQTVHCYVLVLVETQKSDLAPI